MAYRNEEGMRPIRLNAFAKNAVSHQSPGLWRHPDDRGRHYTDLDHWVGLAKTLDQAGFDALFLADTLGFNDSYGGSRDAAVASGVQIPMGDPMMLVSAMAAATNRLGFGITASVSYEHPYTLARRFTTLDHLTKGRVGWNVVTSYQKSASENLGVRQLPHDERYALAEEYLEVCYKLWEGSWEDDAVVDDTATGIFADPAKVHDIDHHGKYFDVPGAFVCEPSPQRTPVIFQAGASSKGLAFATRHAEAVFVSGPTTTVLASNVAKLREQVAAAGRDPYSVKVYIQLTPIVADTDKAAQQKFRSYLDIASREGALALFGGWTGLDLSNVPPSQPLRYVDTDAGRSALAVFTSDDPDREWTTAEIAQHIAVGGRGPVAVGSPVTVADEMERWVDETDADGFNLAFAVTPGTFADVAEYVVPELRRRGRAIGDDRGRTLREALGAKGSYLPTDHVGSTFRR